MIQIKAKSQIEFFRIFIAAQSLKYDFNSREAEVAAQFLNYRYKYLKEPLKIIQETLNEVTNEIEEVEIIPPLMEQLKHRTTLAELTKNIDMSFTVFRKHVASLKQKKFFEEGEIAKDFITDGVGVTILIKKE